MKIALWQAAPYPKIMLAIILKDLRFYSRSRKYRRIQFLTLCVLALLLFVATVEFYAYRRTGSAIDVGKQVYTLFLIALFLFQFWVPRHAVEALHMERAHHANRVGVGENGALLQLTPLANWKILAGKLSAVVLWALWSVWLTLPLLALSNYIGGLALAQLVRCGAVLLVSCMFFAMSGIGIALWHAPALAKGISYGFVLFITFLPLIPFPHIEAIPMFAAMSPLCTLLSVIRSDPTQLWVWHIGLFCGLSFLIFPILAKRVRFSLR